MRSSLRSRRLRLSHQKHVIYFDFDLYNDNRLILELNFTSSH
jgi:hypothetical protein